MFLSSIATIHLGWLPIFYVILGPRYLSAMLTRYLPLRTDSSWGSMSSCPKLKPNGGVRSSERHFWSLDTPWFWPRNTPEGSLLKGNIRSASGQLVLSEGKPRALKRYPPCSFKMKKKLARKCKKFAFNQFRFVQGFINRNQDVSEANAKFLQFVRHQFLKRLSQKLPNVILRHDRLWPDAPPCTLEVRTVIKKFTTTD